MSSPAVATDTESIAQLQKYTACDVSDALLKLKVPNAGFLADLNLYCGSPSSAPAATQADVTVRPVSTVLFVPKDQQDSAASLPPSNIPKDAHWVDLACPGTFAILKQPAGQVNAVCGGIMALRMKVLDVKGIIVAGRVRDLVELQSTGLPVCHFSLISITISINSTSSHCTCPCSLPSPFPFTTQTLIYCIRLL